MRIFVILLLSGTLGVLGCDSESTGDGGSGGAGGEAGMGGEGGTGGMSGAAAFCGQYVEICGFGSADRYADREACIAAYDGYDAGRQACVETHLGLAQTMGAAIHCPHATGEAPCD